MAFVAQDDKQNVNGQQPGQGAQGGASTGGGVSFAGSGGFSTNPVSTAGVGAGGAGGWTNIQSYLSANQGNTGSADALKNTAGSAFDSEQKNLDQSSSDAKSKADSEVQKTNIGQDQASQMVQEMGNNYNYGGQQNQTYNQDLNRFQTGLNSTYGGPTSYNYGMGADAQRYGQALGSDQGFQGLMSDVYNKAAGGVMNQGALSLQQNLDTNNDALNSERQALTQQYAGLQNNIQNTVQSTDAALKAAQQQFGTGQHALRDYLMGQQSQNKGAVQSALDAYNSQEQAMRDQANATVDFTGDAQGYASGMGPINSWTAARISKAPFSQYTAGTQGDLTNVGGVDDQRNRYNAISQALGVGDLIGRGADAQHGSLNFDQSDFDRAMHTNLANQNLWGFDSGLGKYVFKGTPQQAQQFNTVW